MKYLIHILINLLIAASAYAIEPYQQLLPQITWGKVLRASKYYAISVTPGNTPLELVVLSDTRFDGGLLALRRKNSGDGELFSFCYFDSDDNQFVNEHLLGRPEVYLNKVKYGDRTTSLTDLVFRLNTFLTGDPDAWVVGIRPVEAGLPHCIFNRDESS